MNTDQIIKALTVLTSDVANAAAVKVVFRGQSQKKEDLWARAVMEDAFGESRSVGSIEKVRESMIGTWTVDVFQKDGVKGDAEGLAAAQAFESGLSFRCLTIHPGGNRLDIGKGPIVDLPTSDGFIHYQMAFPIRAYGITHGASLTIDLS